MNAIETRVIPPSLMAAIQEAADKAAQGIRDPEEMREAAEEMDRISEEIRQKHGTSQYRRFRYPSTP